VSAQGGDPLSSSIASPARALIVSQGNASVHGRTRRGPRRYRAVSVEFRKNRRTAAVLGGVLESAVHFFGDKFPKAG
jgi:hypothetical protein